MEFDKLADDLIQKIMEIMENQDIEVDYANNTLHIENDDNHCVISKNNNAQEIWIASPLNGAKHFKYDQMKEQWLDSNNQEIFDAISQEF